MDRVHIKSIVRITSMMLFFAVAFSACKSSEEPPVEDQKVVVGEVPKALEEIRERGKLIAITDYNSISYFVYRGEPMGYQFELLKSFAKHLDVELDILIDNRLTSSFNRLDNGECDLLALDLTVTKDRNRRVDFSNPFTQTRQVLVQKKPYNWRKMNTWDDVESSLLRNQLDLAGKTIHIQKNAAFLPRLNNLMEEIGDTIYIVEDTILTVEQLIEKVSIGNIEYTVADEHIAMVNQKYYPDIDVNTPVSFPQNVAWAVKEGSYQLLSEINLWLEDYKRSKESAYIYNKYFRNPRSVRIAQSEYYSVTGGKISQYDEIIKEQSAILDWDWRLLASLIYQESGFDPNVQSWVGAFGLMQLMPATAEIFGVDSLSPPRENIEAGVKFLKWLDAQFVEFVEDEDERRKFVMAAYNVGIAHVFDAMRLAEKYGKNPSVWKDNVDYYILNKSDPKYYTDPVAYYGYARGEEPFKFVNEILERFDHYRNVID